MGPGDIMSETNIVPTKYGIYLLDVDTVNGIAHIQLNQIQMMTLGSEISKYVKIGYVGDD
jgi:hypothetical protein